MNSGFGLLLSGEAQKGNQKRTTGKHRSCSWVSGIHGIITGWMNKQINEQMNEWSKSPSYLDRWWQAVVIIMNHSTLQLNSCKGKEKIDFYDLSAMLEAEGVHQAFDQDSVAWAVTWCFHSALHQLTIHQYCSHLLFIIGLVLLNFSDHVPNQKN